MNQRVREVDATNQSTNQPASQPRKPGKPATLSKQASVKHQAKRWSVVGVRDGEGRFSHDTMAGVDRVWWAADTGRTTGNPEQEKIKMKMKKRLITLTCGVGWARHWMIFRWPQC